VARTGGKVPVRMGLFPRGAAPPMLRIKYRITVPLVRFTQNIQRHVGCPPLELPGSTVREALNQYFLLNERARAYVLDDQGKLRQHMAVFVNGKQIDDREGLSDPVAASATIDLVQALSGGNSNS